MRGFAAHRPSARNLYAAPLAGLALLGLLVTPADSLAQKKKKSAKKAQKAAQAAETFEETTQVVEVQVPVNVTDRAGNPVRGLTPDDFEIFDGGKRREITAFEVVDLDLVEPGYSRAEVEASVPSAARRHFLLLFDLSFSTPNALLRAREAARVFVADSLHPTDLVAVGTHSVESGGNLLVTFTPDRAQIARAIDTMGAPRLTNLLRQDPLRFLIDEPDSVGLDASRDLNTFAGDSNIGNLQQSIIAHLRVIGKQMARMERSFARGRISSWSRSMAELARFMDSVSGRKHVVYFSEGFDGRLLLGRQPSAEDREAQEDLQNIITGNLALVDTDDMYGNTGLQSEIGLMLEEFRRADCVIQAVDISGLTAETAATERQQRVGQDALFYIANDTGGELFEDANDFGHQLGQVLERSSVTYLLTFQASDVVADGSYHRLKVKANTRGARVSSRKGYYAPRPYQELHPLEKGLLASDAIASATPKTDLTLDVLAAPFRANENQAYVPIIIETDGDDLLLGHDSEQMPVEFYTYVTDEHGEMKDFFTQVVTLDLSQGRETLAATGLKYYGHLDLAPGDYLIRVLVRNARTGRTGVETLPLAVPAYQQAEPVLLPPFFVEEGPRWFLVREKTSQEFQRSVVYPFTVNGEPYIPAARPALQTDDDARLCLVAYNLGDEEPEVDGRIVTEDGRIVGGGALARVERTVTGIEGLDKFTATFRPNGLEAGSYTLQVALTDPETGRTETNSIPFTLGLN